MIPSNLHRISHPSHGSDRFVTGGYGEGNAFRRQLELLARINGIDGVALAWPCHFRDGAALRALLADIGLQLGTVDTDVYTEACFKHGSLANPEPAVRRMAIERVKGAIDAALAAGAPDVNLWLGHDGFDYPLQGHYADAWEWIEEGVRELAAHDPAMPISLEYKTREPRANQYLANMGKALLLVNKIARAHLGITLDVGHSLAAQENPAECAVLALREGRLQQVHLNDNYRDWDHDLAPGAINFWEFVEFFYWVRRLGYAGWYSLDIFPYRDDGEQILRQSVHACRTCWALAGYLLQQDIEPLLRAGEHLQVKSLLWDLLGQAVPREIEQVE